MSSHEYTSVDWDATNYLKSKYNHGELLRASDDTGYISPDWVFENEPELYNKLKNNLQTTSKLYEAPKDTKVEYNDYD